ncbi:MAG: glycosyltransferase family 2 protein [Cyanobacteria bacterium P01_A01_bin.17]
MSDQNQTQFVSVMVPVFNDAERLQLCLAALEQQSYDPSAYEVIVIDNGSDRSQGIAEIAANHRQTRYVNEPQPGSYAARNRGIAAARGTIFAFTDADCIPAADWLEAGVSALLQMPNCGLVAGAIDIFFRNPQRPSPIELYESITAFPQADLLARERGAATANLFTFRAVMDRVGLFDGSLKSRGDLEWGQRVYAAGYQQCYVEAARVQHPARYAWGQLYQRTVRLVGGEYDLSNRRSQPDPFFAWTLATHLVPPLRFVVNTFRNSALQGMQQKAAASLAMFFVRYVSAWELVRLRLGGVSPR